MAVRVGQAAPEAVVDAAGTDVHVGQIGLEVLADAGAATVTIGQVGVEVVRTFGCVAVPVPLPTATTRLIRRVRRAPHLSASQVRQFFARFQLDVQTGVGLRTGLGSDPLVCLRWSDDGGHTWSNEHLVPAGRIGEYSRRAIWRRLGHARDRVFEVSVSDPVAWRILDAYLTAELGSK